MVVLASIRSMRSRSDSCFTNNTASRSIPKKSRRVNTSSRFRAWRNWSANLQLNPNSESPMFRKEVPLNDRDQILSQLTEILEEMFEIDAAAVLPSARLYDDLDIDSIDAVDLVARLRSITGKKIDPEMFKSARTVDDVVGAVLHLVNS